jgi:hypothetical protein
MDELWQRYRSFWVPVLIGLGVFLIGLIAVHVIPDDPETNNARVRGEVRQVKRLVAPTDGQMRAASTNADTFRARVTDWAGRLDQARGEDPLEYSVGMALQSSMLRGIDPDEMRRILQTPDSPASMVALSAFDGDPTAASRALQRYEGVRGERLTLLRSGDPNVGFSRLLGDVWSEFKLRANRADVELPGDVLGFAGVATVTRASLVQRLLNLALISQIVDLAIRSDVRSVDGIRVDARPDEDATEQFVRQWPVRVELVGDMLSVQPLFDFLTDPEHPVPVTQVVMTQPSRKSGSAQDGLIKVFIEAWSTLVRPEASLDLDQEE